MYFKWWFVLQKKKRYAKVVSKLKDKLILTTAKLEEMEIERDALK